MAIESISCLPFFYEGTQTQTPCSLVTRIAVVALAVIALSVGILALSGMHNLHMLGISGGAGLTVAGGLILFSGMFFKCIKKNNTEISLEQSVQKNVEQRALAAQDLEEAQQALDKYNGERPPTMSRYDWRAEQIEAREIVTKRLASMFAAEAQKKSFFSSVAVKCILYDSEDELKLRVDITLPLQSFLKCTGSSSAKVKKSAQLDCIPITFTWPSEGTFIQRAESIWKELDAFMEHWPQMKKEIETICYEDHQEMVLPSKTITEAQFQLTINSISIDQEAISLSGSLGIQTITQKQNLLCEEDQFSLAINLNLTAICKLQDSTVELDIVFPEKGRLICKGYLGDTITLEKHDFDREGHDVINLNFTWPIEVSAQYAWEQLDRIVEWWPQMRELFQSICYEDNQCMVSPSVTITQARFSFERSSIFINEEEIYIDPSIRMQIVEIEDFQYSLDFFSLGVSYKGLTIGNATPYIQNMRADIKRIFSESFDSSIKEKVKRGEALASFNFAYLSRGKEKPDEPKEIIEITAEEIAELDKQYEFQGALITAFEEKEKDKGLTLLRTALIKTHPDHAAHFGLNPEEQTSKFQNIDKELLKRANHFFKSLEK